MPSYLIPYQDPRKIEGHEDPMFEEYTYGDIGSRGKKLLNNVDKGDYLFFHTTQKGKRVLTSYFVVEKTMPADEAKQNKLITMKYKNPHLDREEIYEHDTLAFGNPIFSNNLKRPLELTKELLQQLSIKTTFNRTQTELGQISSTLRSWRELGDDDIEFLLNKIAEIEERSFLRHTPISTKEIEQLREEDIENFIEENPKVLGNDIQLLERQYTLQSDHRIDLLCKDNNGYVVVEIKLGSIGRDAYKQVRKYMKQLKKEEGEQVRGILVCADILPVFEDYLIKRINEGKVEVYLYSWKFTLNPFRP